MPLPRLPPDLALALLAALALVVLVQTLRLSRQSTLPARRMARARQRGAEGERRAEPLLKSFGFAILGKQVAGRYDIAVDGERVAIDVRADYVVALDGKRYVAEVKTGTFAPRIETSATRRQLLEYRVAFDVDGILLVDADAGHVRLIEIPVESRREASDLGARFFWLIAGLVVGAALVAWVVSRAS